MKKYLKWMNAENLSVLAGLLLISVILGKPAFIGVADNGDFLRIMNTVGLNYYNPLEAHEDRFFTYSHERFAYDIPFRGLYPSSQIIIVFLVRLIAELVNSSYFNIRILGGAYALLILTALWLLVKHNKQGSLLTGLVLGGAILFVFFDTGYLAYFHSLFGEPVSLIAMLLVFALGLKLLNQELPTRSALLLLFAAILLLITAKLQNAPIGILFALIFLRFSRLRQEKSWRVMACCLSLALALTSIALYAAAPKGLKHINLYQTVFYGILYDSPNVKADLKEMGLPEQLEVLAGTNFFESGTAIPQTDASLKGLFYDRVSHKDVLFFYMKHPERLIGNMRAAAENGFSIRPYYLGNYEKDEQKGPGALSYANSGWSELKNRVLPHSLGFITVFYLCYYGGAIYIWVCSKHRNIRMKAELLMLLGLIGLFALLTPVLGDGLADIGKHLFLFNVCFDMMTITMLVSCLQLSIRLLPKNPNKQEASL
jgi:hypothetical protein